ncbi:helix-turn-helix domain-containing protein [Mucilaginibacter sp.]|uniref:winged helix-turn-helix transcriptional regulator n=1 Tax=Mucilaginibacter sp. TaxID=1882438 RepID=UPI0026257ABF|nr:helix-turn-helix domain-containing protein [Mucilaginibacter sp.]MDB5029871.1 HxlR family transcriptional regulator [Mucilaginibacter sp.]
MEEEMKIASEHSPKDCTTTLMNLNDALYAIGGKWKLRVVMALMGNTTRFNELQRIISGISARVLSNELKELELNGFVNRKVFTGTPVIIEYELTAYSQTLHPVLKSLSDWGSMHRAHIRKSK